MVAAVDLAKIAHASAERPTVEEMGRGTSSELNLESPRKDAAAAALEVARAHYPKGWGMIIAGSGVAASLTPAASARYACPGKTCGGKGWKTKYLRLLRFSTPSAALQRLSNR